MSHTQRLLANHMIYLCDMKESMERQIRENKRDCPHILAPLTEHQKLELIEDTVESWYYSDAHCLICNEHFGYRCVSSPDEVCHYFTDGEEKVHLIDGQRIDPPAGHNKRYETSDCCIFCSAPEERK